MLDSLGEPPVLYSTGPLHRSVPVSDEVDPARAHWISLVLADPAAARREALEAKRSYWRSRLQHHEQRLAQVRAELDAALYPARDVRQVEVPPAEVFRLRCEYAATWADVQAARAQVAALEH